MQITRIIAIIIYAGSLIQHPFIKQIKILSFGMFLSFILSAFSYSFTGAIGFALYSVATLLLSSFASIAECVGLCMRVIRLNQVFTYRDDGWVEHWHWYS
jgi:hypothetical protein